MELVRGCRDAAQLREVQRFVQHTRLIAVSEEVSLAAYRLMESFCLSHGLLIPDALLAATCLEHGLTLYTRNVRHFSMILGLRLRPPY